MWMKELCQRWLDRRRTSRHARPQGTRRRGVRLTLEQLEDRTVPSSFTAASVSDLIADINAANLAGGSNTITLAAGTTFALAAANNNVNSNTDGANGLPIIAANDNLSIAGNGDTIERSTAKGTAAFRLFEVASGASLTLANLTVQGGLADLTVPGGLADYSSYGAAILNQGTLALNAVSVQNNIARGVGGGIYSSGSLTLQGCTVQKNQAVFGGGIYSSGSLMLQGCTVQNNRALGGNGASTGNSGGDGLGGGLYVRGGTASLTNVRLYANTATGGDGANGGKVFLCDIGGCGTFHVNGGNGGNGLGGGMFVAGGTVSLHNTTVDANSAVGGKGGNFQASDGLGEGAGIYIYAGASVCLDAFTVAHVTQNTPDNIYGSYTICP